MEKYLWGDFHHNVKENIITDDASKKSNKPMFVQYILENIWGAYGLIACPQSAEIFAKIAEEVAVTLIESERQQTDTHVLMKTILSKWLPFKRTLIEAVGKMPDTVESSNSISRRAQQLIEKITKNSSFPAIHASRSSIENFNM